MDFSLSRSSIIRSRKDIEALLKEGRIVTRTPIKVRWKRGDAEFSRMMVSVPKSNFKHAVDRNLLKRRIREAFRLNRAVLGGKAFDMMFVYVGKEIGSYDLIAQKVVSCLTAIASAGGENDGEGGDER